MLKHITGLLVLTLVLLTASHAISETEINVTGEVRVRSELDSKSFEDGVDPLHYTWLRTRVTTDAKIEDNTHAVIQFQDSRKYGENGLSGSLSNGKNVDIHQAYLQVDHLWNNGIGVKAGRFEVVLGGQRLFGSVGWHNVGRSWEGTQFWLNREQFRVDAFCLKKMELNNTTGNTDFDIIGGQLTCKKIKTEVFGFYENDALKGTTVVTRSDTAVIFPSDYQNLQRFTFGIHRKNKINQFDCELNAAYQLGTMQSWLSPDTTNLTIDEMELDISAFMFTWELGYNFDNPQKLRIAAGIDYTSGDDNAADDKYKAFNNLYYTGHKFRGFMDYFLASPASGLMDIMLRGKFNPTNGWTVKGDIHLFKRTAEYVDYNGAMTKDAGTEFDLTVSTNRIAGLKFAAGGGVFLPTDAFAGVDSPDPAFWGWLQATAGF